MRVYATEYMRYKSFRLLIAAVVCFDPVSFQFVAVQGTGLWNYFATMYLRIDDIIYCTQRIQSGGVDVVGAATCFNIPFVVVSCIKSSLGVLVVDHRLSFFRTLRVDLR